MYTLVYKKTQRFDQSYFSVKAINYYSTPNKLYYKQMVRAYRENIMFYGTFLAEYNICKQTKPEPSPDQKGRMERGLKNTLPFLLLSGQ